MGAALLAATIAGCAADDRALAVPPGPGAGDPARAAADAGPRGDDLETCGTIALSVRPRAPTVVLLVDRSGSMAGPFLGAPDRSRWEALREGLFAPPAGDLAAFRGGVVRTLAPDVRFGLALYTAQHDTACPALVRAAPAFDQSNALARVFDASPPPMDGKTPTGAAIHAVLDALVAESPPGDGPTYLVLATDGDPDRCDAPSTRDDVARSRSVEAVRRGFSLGIRTFVVALGEIQATHLQALANAGAGLPAPVDGGPAAPYWFPREAGSLGDSLWQAVGAGLSCRLEIDGRVDPHRACEGSLRIDGEAVPCDAPGGGWRALDASHLELLGATCDALRRGEVRAIAAELPCELVLL